MTAHSRLRPGARPAAALTALAALLMTGAPSATAVDEVVGTLAQFQVDPLAGGGTDETRSAVRVNGELLPVDPVEGSTGDSVRVRLEADGTGTVVETLPALAGAALDGATASVLGAHTLTILPVWWSGHVQDSNTTETLSTLARAVGTYWSQQSGAAIATATSVRGWTQVAAPARCDDHGLYGLMADAVAAAGIPEQRPDRQHVVVYFASWPSCGGWAGYGSVSGPDIWINGEPYEDVVAHEVGHNLGLGHAYTLNCSSGGAPVALAASISACTAAEYADLADVMGYGMRRAAGNLNSALGSVLGLVRSVAVAPGTTTLSPLSATEQLRAVVVPTSAGTVYLDYRPATGRDVRAPAWAGVQAHLLRGNESYLLDLSPAATFDTPYLAVGASWTVPGTSTVISVTSAGDTAQIQVSGATWVGVERFWSPRFGNAHFYTADAGEAEHLRTSDPNWVNEGRAFAAAQPIAGVCTSGTQAVYRFYSPMFTSHFFTQSASERDHIIAVDRNWTYEGLAYCTYPTAVEGTTALYRFWSPVFGKHFYTASQGEADHLRAADPNWTYEGVAYHVLP